MLKYVYYVCTCKYIPTCTLVHTHILTHTHCISHTDRYQVSSVYHLHSLQWLFTCSFSCHRDYHGNPGPQVWGQGSSRCQVSKSQGERGRIFNLACAEGVTVHVYTWCVCVCPFPSFYHSVHVYVYTYYSCIQLYTN